MKLEWKSYGDHGRTARGEHGTWRVVTDGMWWFLSVQPTFTRGMLSRGKYATQQDAMAMAQDHEDYQQVPQPIEIEQT
jgi:hypothetical protein